MDSSPPPSYEKVLELNVRMIYHKICICNLCGLHELSQCESSNFLLEKMIFHKIHICNLCGLYELCVCVSSNCMLEKMVFYNIYICNFCVLHELYECVFSNVLLTGIAGVRFSITQNVSCYIFFVIFHQFISKTAKNGQFFH